MEFVNVEKFVYGLYFCILYGFWLVIFIIKEDAR